MLAIERHNTILEYLKVHNTATTIQLSELTNASLATLRRDLNQLAKQGLLKKTHGGAQALPTEPSKFEETAIFQEADPFFSFKDAIAKRAVSFINTNDIIFIGAGMTCNLLCKYLNQSSPEHLTVVTTNVTAVMELAQNPNISTLLLGGNIHVGVNHIETLDEYTVQSLEKLYFNKTFITADGIDLTYGYSIINRAQLPLYDHLIHNSQEIYLLANEGKFNKRTFTQFCSLDGIPNIIANSTIEQTYLDYYAEHGVNVVTV